MRGPAVLRSAIPTAHIPRCRATAEYVFDIGIGKAGWGFMAGSVVYEESAAAPALETGGRGGVQIGDSSFLQSAEYSAFGHSFAGWLDLSDLIADYNPELGDSMRALAAVLQASIEQSFAAQFPAIRGLLADAGIPSASIDDAERALFSGLMPLSVPDLSAAWREAYAELRQTGTLAEASAVDAPVPAVVEFMASVMHYGAHAMLGTDIDEVDLPPALPIENLEALPDPFKGIFMGATSFRVAASLELPYQASGSDFSIWCQQPLRRKHGDNLVAAEHTYINRVVEGLTNPRFQGSGTPVKIQYRPDIGELLPVDFAESIDLGTEIDNYYYVYELMEPKRSWLARKLQRAIQFSGVPELCATAVQIGVTAGAAAAGPIGVALSPLASPASRIVADELASRLKKGLTDTIMTPWSITHMTLRHPAYPIGPFSIFTLLSPMKGAQGAHLHRVTRDRFNPQQSVMDLDYRISGQARARQRSRWMAGVSQPPRPCPADLWQQVAAKNQPAAWTEPFDDGGGFRVLVPHAEPGKGVSYVSALRADVFELGSSL
jgi:hypothetical protein